MKHKIVNYLYCHSLEVISKAILLHRSGNEALLYVSIDNKNFKNIYDFIARVNLCNAFSEEVWWSGDNDFPLEIIKSDKRKHKLIEVFDIKEELEYLDTLKVFK